MASGLDPSKMASQTNEPFPSSKASFEDLYPERRGKKIKFSTYDLISGRTKTFTFKNVCQQNILKALQAPLIKLMVSALENAGCKTDLLRHFSCDICKEGGDIQHFGGYDEMNNQIFFCCNNSASSGHVHGTMLRGLLHMFDVCTRKVDFLNVEHLACMEIRKANLANCNYMIYFTRPESTFSIDEQHRKCVQNTAVEFLMKTRFVEEKIARAAVEKVFTKCYSDLEPIGRRVKDMDDMKRAEREKFMFGY